jgi:hypothetical protein
MSQNIYDANGNFVAGSYLDGMWSGPRPSSKGPFTGDVDISRETAELDAKRGSSVGPQYQGAVQQGLMGQSPERGQPQGQSQFPQSSGGGGGGLGSPAGGQQNINLGQVGLTFSPNGNSGAAANGYNKWQFAEGGSVPQGLASLGRGQDSMLVHMTPGEVQGLQQLAMAAGGSLTINPHTGLAEAGFLSSMLPMLASAVGAYLGGPMGATAAGAIVGGMTNKKNPLMGAISGGISGYGTSGLMSGLDAAGEAAIGANALGNTGLAEATKQAALEGITLPADYTRLYGATSGATPTQIATSGFGAAANNPLAFAKNNLGSLAAASAPLVSNMLSQQQPTLANLPKQNIPRQTYDYSPGTVNPDFGKPGQPYFLNQGYTRTGAEGGLFYNTADEAYPQARLPLQHMAGGGDIYSDDKGAGIYDDDSTGVEAMFAKASPATLVRYKKAAKNARVQAAAINELNKRANAASTDVGDDTEYAVHGGLMGLNEYAAGGKLLRGAGDGMSDSIPAVIKGAKPQRAALADGEFVIPADVVSHLGNGSTEAGAKRLYSMMDKVRHARTGNPKQGKQINPDRFMPA